uniref:ATP synthase complex subunit 8 n=1 Tax=Fabaeformiscandona kushiroensis TaxID=1564202 RepID=A0A0S3PNB2_9CRUS|nr:ATPase subuint 8 [Fabaeformiscandona kushiroensis]
MPQMHPLLWTFLFSFSLICLAFTFTILFFSASKISPQKNSAKKPQLKNLNWKW